MTLLARCLLLGAMCCLPARGGALSCYFGAGCFWSMQHALIEFEQSALGRADANLTAIAAYAGDADAAASPRLCYHNARGVDDYGAAGAAEVVAIELADAAQLERAARLYFSRFARVAPGVWARPDPYDVGPEYRAVVGVPGGLDGPGAAALRAANNQHNMTLVAGVGADGDTLGTNRVYVMDSGAFPARQAEPCMQLRDDATEQYPAEYHALNASLAASGRVVETGCPPNYVC